LLISSFAQQQRQENAAGVILPGEGSENLEVCDENHLNG